MEPTKLTYAEQSYGSLADLNTCREILDAVGKEVLESIIADYLETLDTSAAVYEKNGDYACGIFASGWCRLMDATSRGLCGTKDNQAALQSGKWHCHESCWETSKKSMETKRPTDLPCLGGIQIYAVPIYAGGEVIGSINFGYSDPPRDPQKLQEVSERYGLATDHLAQTANEYQPRSPATIEIARKRLAVAAHLIGLLVEKRRGEASLLNQLKEKNLEFSNQMSMMMGREERVLELKREINDLLQKLGRPTKFSA